MKSVTVYFSDRAYRAIKSELTVQALCYQDKAAPIPKVLGKIVRAIEDRKPAVFIETKAEKEKTDVSE